MYKVKFFINYHKSTDGGYENIHRCTSLNDVVNIINEWNFVCSTHSGCSVEILSIEEVSKESFEEDLYIGGKKK